MDDATRARVEADGFAALELLKSNVVKRYFQHSADMCYNNIESWDGFNIDFLVHEVKKLQSIKSLEKDLVEAAELAEYTKKKSMDGFDD